MSRVLRVVLTDSGIAKINFEDNVVVTVDPHGRSIALSAPSRPLLHTTSPSASAFSSSANPPPLPPRIQLLDYLTRDVSARVVPVLDQIINPLLDEPLICRPLIESKRKEKGGLFTTGYEVTSSLWSQSAESATAAGLVEFLPDGSVCLDSEDASSHFHLASDGTRATVTFPLCVGREEGGAQRFEHVWCTRKVYLPTGEEGEGERPATDLVPSRWLRPYLLAEHLRLQRRLASSPGSLAPHLVAALTQAINDTSRLLTPDLGLPRACELPRPSPSSPPSSFAPSRDVYEAGSWWTDPTTALFPPLSKGHTIRAEWTPAALFLSTPGSDECKAIVHCDLSTLHTAHAAKFIRHAGRTYAADAVPPYHIPIKDATRPPSLNGSRYRLAPIAEHLVTFRTAVVAARSLLPASGSVPQSQGAGARSPGALPLQSSQEERGGGGLAPSTPSTAAAAQGRGTTEPGGGESEGSPSPSSGVRQMVENESGLFTAYQDGSVVIRFADRTILSWNRPREPHVCHVITHEGESRRVPTLPGREALLGDYIRAATQFAHWAFTSPAERAEELHRRGFVEAEVSRTVRGALICALEAGVPVSVPGLGSGSGTAEGNLETDEDPEQSRMERGTTGTEPAASAKGTSVVPEGLGFSYQPGEVGVRPVPLSTWGRLGGSGGAVEALLRRNEAMLRLLMEES